MGNCLPTDVRLHRKYDLKGSTYGRTAGMKAQNPNAILKVTLSLMSTISLILAQLQDSLLAAIPAVRCHLCLLCETFAASPAWPEAICILGIAALSRVS